jgi:hypothetical protein
MKKTLQPALALVALVLSTLACSLGAKVEPTGVPTNAPSNVLFQDDFSDKTSGWHVIRENDQIVDYEQDGLRFLVTETQFDFWSVPGLSFGDAHIEVNAVKLGGPDDNDFGVICRYQDDQHFYGFLISSDGYYGISKMAGGEHNLLGSEDMLVSDAISKGTANNKIAVDCVGSTLRLTVNGTQLIEVQDTEYTKGDVGLMAGTFDVGGVDILFDNFVVTKP